MLFGLTLMLCFLSAGWSDSFPRTNVQTLAGSAFVLPDDLEADTNILVVGFTQKAGPNTKPWTERLKQDFTHTDGFAVYPVAVLAGVSPLFRGFALSSIRSGIAPQDSGHFLIVDRDQSAWRALADYRLPDDPYIIVLDKNGNLLARFKGVFDEKNYQKAAAQIRSAVRGKS